MVQFCLSAKSSAKQSRLPVQCCFLALQTHSSILSSSVSLMAQGVGMTINAESGILARPVSTTMLAFLTILWWNHRQILADSTLRQRAGIAQHQRHH